ncbi:MAG: phosphotransferase, partial [Anaerolineae bacterium]|nr:phosphotransferase [Anaerolineae bacterium]
MTPFSALTDRGKARRLRYVALAALAQYDVEIAQLELVGLFTNALFRLRTPSGASYAVRLCAPAWRTDTDILSEIMWLEALAQEPKIAAPVPVRARHGEAFVSVAADNVPGPNRCVVMSWLPGTPLGRQLSEANLAKMGALFARLHTHGAAFVPPEGFTTRRMTSYIARDEPDLLFEGGAISTGTARAQEILRRTRDAVARAFADLYADPAGLCVIHNDLWHDNIKIYGGRLQPLDFEDTIWGYPVQDIAMALQDLMTDVAPDHFEPYVNAFRHGYERLL